MTEPPLLPTRLLKAVSVLVQWFFGIILAVGLLLTATWGALHGWIVPRIGDYRLQIQAQAEEALGVPVRLGAILVQSNGLVPSIELHDVALLDAQGRKALQLPRVVVALSARSLWRLGFERLYIENPEIDIRRSADGRVWVAGLELTHASETSVSASDGPNPIADWVFSQPEVQVHGGTARWTDDQRGTPVLGLGHINVLLQNHGWRHRVRIDATPASEWGGRFGVMGVFRQPLLSTHNGHWQRWSGQLFADFAQLDLSPLRHYWGYGGAGVVGTGVGMGVGATQGKGALRAWVDIDRGQWAGATIETALTDLEATAQAGLPPFKLAEVQGSLKARRLAQGFEASTHGLHFVTHDGIRWTGGNLHTQYSSVPGRERGDFQADRLDLAVLAQFAGRLPLGDEAHHALHRYAPRGVVESVRVQWQGTVAQMMQVPDYQLQAKITGLALGGAAMADTTWGVHGANVEVQATQDGGNATLSLTDGALFLPGIFEDPLLPLNRLNAHVDWKINGDDLAVQVSNAQFANADAQGQARAHWRTSDPAHSGSASRFPGVLDLTGHLSRADGTRVHRYLPLVISQEARHYVRDAVQAGRAERVDFRVKGDLYDMPFIHPKQGEFKITAQVKDATYAYVPPQLQAAGEMPWPALTQLSGEMVFDRASLRIQGARGMVTGARSTRLHRIEAHIPDLATPVVSVGGEIRGPLPEWLAFVRHSPVDAMMENALAQASGTGNADLRLHLSLPIEQLAKSKVQGSVILAGNEVRITPETPSLSRVRGTVQFTETGFTLQGIQARALGGDVRLEGGLRALPVGAPATDSALQLRAQGMVSAQGLQQAPELGFLAPLTHHATGNAPYTLALTLRRGTPEVQVQSSLQGMALALPAPLGKTADSTMPLHVETQLTREALAAVVPGAALPRLQEHLAIQVGGVGHVEYVRDISTPQPQVVRGAIAVGLAPDEAMPLPASGVAANIQLPQVDVDVWEKWIASSNSNSDGSNNNTPPQMATYLPHTLALRAGTLTAQGRSLHNVVASGTHQGGVWRTTLDATELSGHLEYRPTGSPGHPAGRLFARLSRLTVPETDANQVEKKVETLLSGPPGQLPALDIEINDLELRGRKLGRLKMEAINQGAQGAEGGQHDWLLQKFNLTTPQAALTASGHWAKPSPQRGTSLRFQLHIHDAGQLLGRFGMAEVVKQGRGLLEGQIAWQGSPLNPHYPSMTGKMHLNVETGQFLQADPGLAKLLSVLSLQSLPRRLALDFRDVFSQGFAFDWVRGDVQIDHGIASTHSLQMKGVNAAVWMEGSADIAQETQNLHVVVVPEINAMTASLVATAINPVVGLGSFLAQAFLRGPLMAVATQEFQISGAWADPQVVRLEGAARTGRGPNLSDLSDLSESPLSPPSSP